MKTAVSIKPVTASQSLTIIGNDGLRHSLNVGEASKIIAKTGEKYRTVKTHNAIDVLADDVVVTKAGDNLELSYADGTHVTLEGFYSADGSEFELPANDGGIHTVTSSEAALSANESSYVYAHGNHDTLMSMTSDNHALQVAVADRTSVSDLPHYSELATGIAGVATDAMAGSGAAATAGTAGTTAAAAGAAAATGTGLSTMAMVGIGAVTTGGGVALLGGGGSGSGSTPAGPADTTPPATIAPAGFHFTDAGRSATDGLSSNPTITLDLASDTARWQYSLDNGTTWANGAGHTITLAEGTYDKQSVQVKQFDAAGNSSISHMSTTATIASSAMVQLDGLNQSSVYNENSQITAVGTAGEYVVTFDGYESTGNSYSIFVQKFNANGVATGAMVQLDGIGVTDGNDGSAQTAAVGSAGEYVTVFSGANNSMYHDNSIFVQKFNADGTISGNMVELQPIGVMGYDDTSPQVTAVGTAGEYVVTFQGIDSAGNNSIFVQKFDATGATLGSMVQLDGLNQSYIYNQNPQITAVGTAGEYVVTFEGYESTGNSYSIFVQKFDASGVATGAMVQLDGLGTTTGNDSNPQIMAVGTNGEYVVTFQGTDSNGNNSIFVQKFGATGATSGSMVQLDGFIGGNSNDSAQITAVGTTGEYVVTYNGYDNNWNAFIFVQKFNADGSVSGTATKLEVTGVSIGNDYNPQITAVGTAGEYVVTFKGADANDGTSIFVQKFHADGTVAGSMSQIDVANASYNSNWSPQITAVGSAGEFAVTFTGTDSTGNDSIFVQKFRADGTYAPDMSNAMIIDTTAPSLAITTADTTNSTNPSISGTAEAGSTITLTIAGATYTATTASNGTWSVYTGNNPTSGTFTLDPNGGNALSVTATDAAGNITSATQTLVLDTVAPATIDPAGFTVTDTGVSASDGITSDTTITVALASDTATWQYSLDGGNNWNTGTGNTITLTDGAYDKHLIQIQQNDAAGNSSVSVMSATATLPDMAQTGKNASASQITAVGTAGEYVVTYQGYDSNWNPSIFVQKFNANGTEAGVEVQLDGLNSNGYDQAPQVTAVGTSGEYVVTFQGADSAGDDSIFVQKFNADGTVAGSMVQLEAVGNTTNSDQIPQITAVGTDGAYAVTFQGIDSTNHYSIFVQKFDATGATVGNMVQLDSMNTWYVQNTNPQIASIGNTGEYVVTFQGYDNMNYLSIFVQKFNAAGAAIGEMVTLSGPNQPYGYDYTPQVTAVGTAGEYVVTFRGSDSAGDYSIFVQKFNPNGTVNGTMVQLEALNNTTGNDYTPQITAVGTTGEYVVSFDGTDANGGNSVFVQKFHADGTTLGSMVQLDGLNQSYVYNDHSQITAVGNAGEYAVTFLEHDSNGYTYVFVQKFNADGTKAGTMVQLDGLNQNYHYNGAPQISAIGTDGGYAVSFQGYDSNTNMTIFVQQFNADGSKMVDTHNRLVVDTTISDATITSAATTGDSTPLLSGTADAGSSVSVSFAGAIYTTTAAGGVWSIDTSTATPNSGTLAITANGDYTVTAVSSDTAGNSSTLAVQTLTIADTTPPAAIAPTGFVLSDVGSSNSDGITSDGTVTLALNGDTVTWNYSLDNGATWTSGSGHSFVLPVGTYDAANIQVEQLDALGNSGISTMSATSSAIVVDTTPPVVAITSSASSADVTPILSGTAEADATITLTLSGATYTTVAAGGVWSIDTTSAIPTSGTLSVNANGNNSVSVTATDAAGNVSTAVTQTLAMDTTPPALIAPSGFVFTDTGSSASDGFTSNGTVAISLANDTATWQYSFDNGATWTTGTGNTFALPEGRYDKNNIQVQQLDALGNASISAMSTTATIPAMAKLEAIGVTTGYDSSPQITALGTTGEYVVTFNGIYQMGGWQDSVYVQKFNADGTEAGAMVRLDVAGAPYVSNYTPLITAVGTAGEYAVAFSGVDSRGYSSIFAQKFNADGTTAGAMVQLDSIHYTYSHQITAVGTAGEYVVMFDGTDSSGGSSVFVQKFNIDGTVAGSIVQLDAPGTSSNYSYHAQATALGTDGAYVVTFEGNDANGYHTVFIQKFDATGAETGAMVQLSHNNYGTSPQITSLGSAGDYAVTFNDGSYFCVQKYHTDGTTAGAMVQLTPNSPGYYPDITAVGTAGEYVVTFVGYDAVGGDWSIYVQKFDTAGAATGVAVQLEAIGVTNNSDYFPQVTSVGTAGEYVVTFEGIDTTGQWSVFVQKFDVTGAATGAMVQLEVAGVVNGTNEMPQVSAVGTAGEYIVTFQGTDSNGDNSIFIQKFNADGTIHVDMTNNLTIDMTAPIFTSGTTAYTHDTITTSTVVYDAQTTEGDIGIHYSISGLDMSQFAINATTGAVTFVSAPSLASPADTGANNVYDFTITATDLAGHTTDQAVALSVTPSLSGTTVTSNGVNFTLGAESVQNGKSYYYVTNINGASYTDHNVLDTAFNGGADTVDTTVTAGVDDARTFISAGVTYVLPTQTELLALSTNTPAGWGNVYFQSATQTSADAHSQVLVSSSFSFARNDTGGDYVVLQVIPA